MDLVPIITAYELAERRRTNQTHLLSEQLDTIMADAERQLHAIQREVARLKALGSDVTPMELHNAGGLLHVGRQPSYENVTATMTRIVHATAIIQALKPVLDKETE